MRGGSDDKTGNTSLKSAVEMVQQFREHPHGTSGSDKGTHPSTGAIKSAPTPKS